MLLKKGGQLKNTNDPLLINVTSAEELLKGIQDTESERTVDNLLACYDRTYFSRSLILNCIDNEFIAFQGDFRLDFKRKPDGDEPLVESVYEEPPELIKSSELLLSGKESQSKAQSQR